MDASNLVRLPPELYRPIVEYLGLSLYHSNSKSYPALSNLSQTCRAFQLESERIMYRRIHVADNTQTAHKVFKVLRKRMAYIVEDLTIWDVGGVEKWDEWYHLRSPRKVVPPFELLVNLRALTLRHRSDKLGLSKALVDHSMFELLENTLPHDILTSFRCSLTLRPEHTSFLKHQSSLRHLFIKLRAPHHTSLITSPDHLRNLVSLESDWETSPLVLRRHPLKALRIISYDPFSLQFWRPHARSILALHIPEINSALNSELMMILDGVPQLRLLSGIEFGADNRSRFVGTALVRVLNKLLHLEAVAVDLESSSRASQKFIDTIMETCKCPNLGSVFVSSLAPTGGRYEMRRVVDENSESRWEQLSIARSDTSGWWTALVERFVNTGT
ncbi:hypothetical protein SISSUDRAFT_1062783 [Sistotremastrum suecicum HHB10207 ss-3]|uniref:F-box domain-containing protein n=1 Tax=Sistotremastrum suecicum HHB10207 ss-3 TaxID=1314776 RepID=A0A166CJM6_9AGAM|nr:hypothetical protein SISSUDRAFT_1062783 [Sistotremastrum suecicum HHB10207 ss-3]